MTDADVDGSHIRTLLLTFFFRQMPELIRRGKVFIAQAPLYQLAWGSGKNKKIEYVTTNAKLADTLTEVGLQRAALVVRKVDSAEGAVALDERRQPIIERRIEGDELVRAIRVLRRLRELVEVAERRGVKFPDLLAARSGDPAGHRKLPTHRLVWTGGEAFAWSESQAREIAQSHGLHVQEMDGEDAPDTTSNAGAGAPAGTAAGAGAGSGSGRATVQIRELHENRELERVFDLLSRHGLSINDYALVQEESVSGEKLATRYAWELRADAHKSSDDAPAVEGAGDGDEERATAVRIAAHQRVVEVASIPGVLDALLEVGRRGLEIKRFKGLGEMDAEQLWETTMDPARRTLLRVSWDGAAEADTLFSILMGEEVDSRRKYIEEHALEVKNLDV